MPWEATVSYGAGTAKGPEAILQASRQVDLYDRETGRPYRAGIFLRKVAPRLVELNSQARAAALPLIAKGGSDGSDADLSQLSIVDRAAEEMNGIVHAETARLLNLGKLPGVLGGDHASPFGAIQAVAESFPGLGILHFDAHADLRDAYEGFQWSHASIFHNVVRRIPNVARIVQVGIRDFCEQEFSLIQDSSGRLVTFFDPDLRARIHEGEPWGRLADEIVAALPEHVYVSFDIDGLDPALCPHTGTPVPGGLSFAEATTILRKLARSGRRVVGFDLNETAPDPTGESEWDANVAARLLYKLIGFALISRGRTDEEFVSPR